MKAGLGSRKGSCGRCLTIGVEGYPRVAFGVEPHLDPRNGYHLRGSLHLVKDTYFASYLLLNTLAVVVLDRGTTHLAVHSLLQPVGVPAVFVLLVIEVRPT